MRLHEGKCRNPGRPCTENQTIMSPKRATLTNLLPFASGTQNLQVLRGLQLEVRVSELRAVTHAAMDFLRAFLLDKCRSCGEK